MSFRPSLLSQKHDIMATALLGENLEVFRGCMADGINPFIPICGSLASERFRGSLTRLGHMCWHDAARVEKLRRMFNCALYYESRYIYKCIVYRFLCRWCQWRRREVHIRGAIWSKKIWQDKTGRDFLGPGEVLYSMLHPGKATL